MTEGINGPELIGWSIAGTAAAPIIMFLIELVKDLAVGNKTDEEAQAWSRRYSRALAALFGLLAGVAGKLVGDSGGSWAFFLIMGLKSGIEAVGWYQLFLKPVKERIQNKNDTIE